MQSFTVPRLSLRAGPPADRPAELCLARLDFKGLKAFRALLKSSIHGVQNIHQGSFRVGMGILDVETRSYAQAMLDEIAGKELNEFNVNVISFSVNKI